MARFAKALFVALGSALLLATSGCSSSDAGDSCNPDDQDGVVGGNTTVLVTVTDSGYAVGGVNSGSEEPNIAVQNLSNVTLTLTNVGSALHDLHIDCISTNLPAGCPAMSCFPASANITALAPGNSETVTFVTPAVEGAYRFQSDEDGDIADGGVPGLVGEFVVM